ncbi:MAG: PAS domain-containing protein [Anaerolineales bacterium]|nr:MAG: PAS domain-containing protein [Anaerolineales bacterium]
MTLEFSPFSVPLLMAGIFAIILTVLAWNRRPVTGGTTFSLLVIAVSVWLFSGALEYMAPTLSAKIFWKNAQYLGITTAPVLWFYFVLKFTNYNETIKRHYYAAFWLYPVIMNLIVWTNPLHHLFYGNMWLNTTGIYPFLDVKSAPLSWVHLAIAYILLLVSTILLWVSYSTSSGVYRKQSQLLLIAVLLPWIANLSDVTHFVSPIDMTPYALTVSLTIIYVALQRYGFLEIVPVAREIIVEHLSDIVIVLDAKSRIVNLNKAARKKLGVVGENAIGRFLRDLIPQYRAILDKYKEQQEAHETLDLIVDGENICLDMQMIPLHNQRGHFTGRIISLRDISVLMKAEKALSDNERALKAYTRELEEQNEELDAFAHTVAHDLKQPLGILLGYSTFLTDSLGSLDQAMLKHSTLMIEQSTRKMSSIVDELLLFASVRKKDTVEINPVAMGEVVASVLSRLDDLIKSTKTHAVVPVAWPKARGYAPWVEEIWVNLITNAIKYGGNPPYVLLAAEPVVYTEGDHKGSWVRFSVNDNGPGISEEAKKLLFVPFERLGQIKFEGSGLGLSIVQRITRRLGGWIGVEGAGDGESHTPATNGSGCTFYFMLPAVYPPVS